MKQTGRLFTAELFGHKYQMEFDTEAEFEEWLKVKTKKIRITSFEKRVYQHLLGIDKIIDEIKIIKEKLI